MKNLIIALASIVGVSSAAQAADYTPTVYGFIKASTVISDHAAESFGRPNSGAYTAAGNPALSLHPNQANYTFQAQQSRIGIKTTTEEHVNALVEMDFYDTGKSTPAVAAAIRLRRATINFKQDDWTFNIGQDWDLFSPLTPYSYNVIGHYFGSGDAGFMRLQAQALKKSGNWEHAFAIGFPGYSNGPQQGTQEFTLTPTLALRETLNLEKHQLGAAAIFGHETDANTDKSINPFALNLFWKADLGDTNINSEVYYGENMENINLYTLGYSSNFKRLKEAGGFITVRHKLSDKHGVFGGLGYARVFNDGNLQPSYKYPSGTTAPTASNAILNLTGTSTGYGIAQNGTARLGYEYYWSSKLNLFAETAFLYTEHVLDPLDQGRLHAFTHTQILELGLKLDI
jgi:opacity protein-like surface antigen